MINKRTFIWITLALVIVVGLIAFSCGVLFFPAISVLAPAPTATFIVVPTSTSTFTPSPLPPIYVTLNVNEFSTYTIYWKRDLWENAVKGDTFTEDFENDSGDYGELSFPYLTGKGLLLNGDSSAQILSDGGLLSSGKFIHFRDRGKGLSFTFPNNAAAGVFGFDYESSEIWQLSFNDSLITLPKGRNRFIGIVIHNFPPGGFVLSTFERAQGGLAVDNITYTIAGSTTTTATTPFPTSANVTITISGGNINIRRGPGADYNPIGAFLDGQSAVAVSRNENGTWLYIPIPGTPDQFGWINATTRLSRVIGDIELLPVKIIEPAKPAYVRNCTPNTMLLRPGDIEIENLLKTPNNVALVYPGDYDVYDTILISNSSLRTLILREGNTIDITEDASHKTHTCP